MIASFIGVEFNRMAATQGVHHIIHLI